VSVLTTARSGSDPHNDAPASASGTRPLVLPAIAKWGPAIWAQIAATARERNADWIHVQYQTAAFNMNPAINLVPRRLRSRFRVAWTYHDLLPPYLFPKAGARLRRWVTQLPARDAALTIVTNEGDRQTLATWGHAAHAIPIGSNVPAITLTDRERAQVRARYGVAERTLLLGFFGFLNRSKGAPTLLRTLRRLLDQGLDARLLLIGEGIGASDPTNRETRDEILAMLDTLELTERVTTTGALPDDDVAAALNAIDILILPFEDGASLRRGTLMAGLANGCAIVTTPPQSPTPELTIGRDLMTAPPGDDESFAAAIRRLVAEPHLLTALRDAARNASTQFTWESIARRHLSLYSAASLRR